MQRNWIGRSTGADVEFVIEGRDEPVTIYTTRPDTLFGATFFVVAADSDLACRAGRAAPPPAVRAEFADVPGARCRQTSEIERLSTERPKTGVFLERYAVNPVNGERLPIYAADYVLADYGHGAIMAVPAHDQRDLDFARAFGLPVRVVVETGLPRIPPQPGSPPAGDGVLVNSGLLDGLDKERGDRRDHRDLEGKGAGPGGGQLPAARLADLAAAVLGDADPDRALPGLRRGRRPRRPAAGGAATVARAWTCAEGHLPAWGRPPNG